MFHESSNKMESKAETNFNFRYIYKDQIKHLKSCLIEFVRKLSFFNFQNNLMKNLIIKERNIKGIEELNWNKMIIMKSDEEKLKIENNYLRAENSVLKTKIKRMKYENLGLEVKNIHLIHNRIALNFKFQNELKEQKSFSINLKDMSRIERIKNNLLL